MEPSAKNLMLNLAATELGLGGQLTEQLKADEDNQKKKRDGKPSDPVSDLLGLASSILGL
jgi:hypothetical protein